MKIDTKKVVEHSKPVLKNTGKILLGLGKFSLSLTKSTGALLYMGSSQGLDWLSKKKETK